MSTPSFPSLSIPSRSTPIQDWELTTDYASTAELMTSYTIARTGLTPKPAQVRFAMALVMNKDITCIAATGFGKSLAFQMAILMMPKKFGIIVTPINALAEDQVFQCKKFRIDAIAFTSEALDREPGLVKDIMSGKYGLGESSPPSPY